MKNDSQLGQGFLTLLLLTNVASLRADEVRAFDAEPHLATVYDSPEKWPWTPDQKDGTFRNPIIFADYSDPDVIRHGDDFYLTASSFNCTPGLPILHSCDLVNWTIINHAVTNLPHPRYKEVQHGCGIWAPAIRFHAGKFWIFFPMPDEGIYVTTAKDPAGKWSEPHLLEAGKGLIDPCPLWDDDGKAYLVHAYARSRSGIKDILRVRPMAPDGSRLLGEGQIVFHDPARHPTLEGPKFYKKNSWYYILAPAGGVRTGWQVAVRSRNIYGPYEDKIVLAQGKTGVNGLRSRGIGTGRNHRSPIQAQIQDFEQADLVIALDEQEHRPYMERWFPDWADRIEYWQVGDLHVTMADKALHTAEVEVHALVQRLSSQPQSVGPSKR